MGVEAEVGANVGAVAKVTPNGNFKCSYTWKKKTFGTPQLQSFSVAGVDDE